MGVEPYEGTVQFVHQLRRNGFKIAVVTSSHNCTAVLKSVKLDDVFEVRVDGNTIQVRVPTKPAMHSNLKPAGYSDLKPATLGVNRMGRFDDVVEG